MVTFKGTSPPKTCLDERQKAFERKYHLDEELAFKAGARRAKLLGLWVAEKLGLTGDEAAAYARQIVEAEMADSAHAAMLKKIRHDLKAKHIALSEEALDGEMERFLAEARTQVMAEVTAGKQQIGPE
jgi:hypothetical protein